jgi:hypothetical protein
MNENERKCASCGAPASNPCVHLRNEGHMDPTQLAAIRAQMQPAPLAPTPAAVPRRNTDADLQDSLKK